MRRLLIALAACAGLLAVAPAAHAHTSLEEARPGPGDRVPPGLNIVALTFDDVSPETTPEVSVLGPDESAVRTGLVVLARGSTACAAVAPLRPGVHTIVYRTVATDGDTQQSRFFFEVAEGADPPTQAPDLPPECRGLTLTAPSTERTALGLGSTTLLLVLLGAVVASAVVAPFTLGRRHRRRGRGTHRRPSGRGRAA